MLAALVGVAQGANAQGSSWQLDSAFGRDGVAGLPLREHGSGTLLAPGPHGSLFVGGYADRHEGAFLVAQMSATGTLVHGFGDGGVTTVPDVYAFPQNPPRMFALAGGKLLLVGLDKADELVAVRLTDRGRLDRRFAGGGVARHKLTHVHGFAVLTAAAVETGGDVLAVYQREAPQPKDEPAIPVGLGEGAIELIRLTASGALDDSFGHGGFLTAGGHIPLLLGYAGDGLGWACTTTIAADGSILFAYEQAVSPTGEHAEAPAVQELSPAGADAAGFGSEGAVYLPFVPAIPEANSEVCDGLFALGGGGVEAIFGGEGRDSKLDDVFRFAPTGAPEAGFGTSGYVTLHAPVDALAVGAGGETLSAGTAGRALVLGGTPANGTPDAALGGPSGKRFAANLPTPRGSEEAPTVELLPDGAGVFVRVGEEIVRVDD